MWIIINKNNSERRRWKVYCVQHAYQLMPRGFVGKSCFRCLGSYMYMLTLYHITVANTNTNLLLLLLLLLLLVISSSAYCYARHLVLLTRCI